jgi:DNA-directed RNA polymerase specialized sigma24 family protein
MAPDWHGGPPRFPTTSWSLVALAGQDEQTRREALGELLTRYMPALRAHLVQSKGLAPDRADDLIQDFVTAKILERDLISRADHQRGKFRTFLLTALDRFLLNRLRDQGAKKRSASAAAEPLGERDGRLAAGPSPTDAFDLAWARSVLGEALGRMRTHCEASGRTDVWGVFECRVLGPILEGTEPPDYRELVRRFGFQSPSQASNLLATAKRTFARTLRAVVGEYAGTEEEIEEELGQLREILARCGQSTRTSLGS